MIKIGVTGGIGSGKSTICKIFASLEIPVYNSDGQAKKIVADNTEVRKKLVDNFGPETFNSEGKFNTTYISDIIFKDVTSRGAINGIIHPFVIEHFNHWAKLQLAPYVIKEAAILFESGSFKYVDKTIVVICNKELRVKRLVQRNGLSLAKIENIMASQMSDAEKCKLADYIIDNNEKTLLLPQILKIHNELTNG